MIITQLWQEALATIEADQETYRRWLNEQLYELLRKENGDHLLVLVGERFCFDEMVKRCQGYRRYSGKEGQEATHSIEQLCRASVVKALYNWSYERLAQEVKQQPLVRWFIGYRLDEAPLSDTTLWHFEQWLKEAEPRLLFSELYKQIREDFPTVRQALQVGDTLTRAGSTPCSR